MNHKEAAHCTLAQHCNKNTKEKLGTAHQHSNCTTYTLTQHCSNNTTYTLAQQCSYDTTHSRQHGTDLADVWHSMPSQRSSATLSATLVAVGCRRGSVCSLGVREQPAIQM